MQIRASGAKAVGARVAFGGSGDAIIFDFGEHCGLLDGPGHG
jgi:hypothetical protein